MWNQQPVRNLLSNPSLETGTVTNVTVRTNLCITPRGVLALPDYNGPANQTITPNVAITGNPDGITTAIRVAYTTGANPGVSVVNPVVSGNTYTIQAWVYFESINTTPGVAGFAQAGVASMGSPPPMTVGVWQKVTWTYTASGTSQIGFRVSGGSGGSGAFLITGIVVEVAPMVLPFFDGASPASGDYTHAWTGAANSSTSIQRGILPASIGVSGAAAIVHSVEWSASGGKSMRVIHTPSSTIAEAGLADIALVLPGKTYTVLGKLRIDKVATSSHTRSRRFNFYWSTNGGANYTEANGPQAANAIGVYDMRYTFTVPSDATNTLVRAGGHSWGSAGIYQADAWWDDLMLVEGEYTGDYVDGTKPFSKWDGTANASTSIGYPQWLYQIAGLPDSDIVTTGFTTLPGGYTNTEPRTIYTVFDGLATTTVETVMIATYGHTDLADIIPNSTMMLRRQGSGTQAVINRRSGGGGPTNTMVPIATNVTVWGMNTSGIQFIRNNNAAIVTSGQVMDCPHEKINIATPSTHHRHIRTLIYRGYHSDATQQAISRYLGNKYGAAVA